MRSSVSAILSDPAPDTTMSFPDYNQSSADHAKLLVLCQHIGHQLKARTFSHVVETISEVQEVRVTDKNGAVRNIKVRYTDRYPTENNEWGEFQAHRRVLGVITVGACSSQIELAELCRFHETSKTKYSSTVFDTRCVVFCLPGRTSESSDSEKELNGDVVENGNRSEGDKSDEEDTERNLDKPPSWFHAQSHKTRLLKYYGENYSNGLKADIQDFISSLFWILESKRVEATRDTSERIPLLCAPFERKDFVGLDMESRNNRKRVLGRLKKHLADVSLQAGLLAEAWNYYQVAADVLRPANDWLWLAASLEGLCAVSVVLQDQQQKGVVMGARGLGDQEMVERYREAVIHYGKYKHAGIIETEASIKAVLVLIKQGNFLLAAEFLQNIVFINLQMNDAEKIARFLALSDLYDQIGFTRKSAFFKRVAAMRCVAPQNPQHDWTACYKLMLSAVPGYSVDLSSSVSPSHGWPALQVQLLQELVGTSRKMGAHSASTRHMTFLLEHMFNVLSPSERQDFSAQLSVLSSRAGSAPNPITLESGIILPAVPLYSIPTVSKFSPIALSPQLTPYQKQKTQTHSGPFLYQSFGGGSARSSGRGKNQPVTWVAGDVGEVVVQLVNPIPVELKVSMMSLLTEGVQVEIYPSQLSLAPQSGPGHYNMNLLVTPKEEGQLKILGYTHTVLGVQSNCLLAGVPNSTSEAALVTVIPRMPQISTLLELQDNSEWSIAASPLNLYSGQTVNLRLTITNLGKEPVGELSLECVMGEGAGPAPLVKMESEILASSLPLEPDTTVSVIISLTGVLETGVGVSNLRPEDSVSVTSDSRWSFSLPSSVRSLTTTGHPSLASVASHGSGGRAATPSGPQGTPHQINFKLEYSNGKESDWCRRAVQQISVLQHPSLVVSRWDVLPGDTQHNCFLVLDLVNKTTFEMELTYTEKKTLLIEAGDMCRVPVPVTKCSFSDSLDWVGGQGVADYLAECVNLSWSIVCQEGGEEITRSGVAGLDSITWTDSMLDLLRRPPLVAEIMVGGVLISEGGEVDHTVGEVMQVDVKFLNQLLEPVCDCSLNVRLQQDGVGTGRGVVGAGSAGAPGGDIQLKGEMLPGSSMKHSTVLLPLCPGLFKLVVSVQVMFRDRPHSWRLAPVAVNVKI